MYVGMWDIMFRAIVSNGVSATIASWRGIGLDAWSARPPTLHAYEAIDQGCD